MHSDLHFSKTLEAYNYDSLSDRAIWAIALVHYWCTHAFQVATCNDFYFNACPLGLTPDGTLCLSMVLCDPHTASYVNDTETIYLTQDIDVQISYFLFSLMMCNHIFDIDMTVVSPIMSMLYKLSFNFLICNIFLKIFSLVVKMYDIFT